MLCSIKYNIIVASKLCAAHQQLLIIATRCKICRKHNKVTFSAAEILLPRNMEILVIVQTFQRTNLTVMLIAVFHTLYST